MSIPLEVLRAAELLVLSGQHIREQLSPVEVPAKVRDAAETALNLLEANLISDMSARAEWWRACLRADGVIARHTAEINSAPDAFSPRYLGARTIQFAIAAAGHLILARPQATRYRRHVLVCEAWDDLIGVADRNDFPLFAVRAGWNYTEGVRKLAEETVDSSGQSGIWALADQDGWRLYRCRLGVVWGDVPAIALPDSFDRELKFRPAGLEGNWSLGNDADSDE